MLLATIGPNVMPARLDPLFPECCYGCAHHQPAGTCGHDFSQLRRQEFAHDPNRPCPVSTETR